MQTREKESVWQSIIWNEEPGGNVEHIEEHGLTVDDVEHVLANYEDADAAVRQDCPACSATRLTARTLSWCTSCLTQTRFIP